MSITEMSALETIEQQIAKYPLILYMKGTPEKPCCGFSARVVQILKACRLKFAHVNVLERVIYVAIYHNIRIGQLFHSFFIKVN